MQNKSIEQYMQEMKELISKANTVRANTVTVAAEPLPLDGKGSLIVVVNSAEDRPLSGATVKISDKDGNLLYTLTTDQSGKTAPVSLAAPLRDNSLEPLNGEIVYGLYDVSASAENFVTSNLRDVPVFDSVVSIQQFRLLWLTAADGQNGEQTESEGNPYTL